MLLAALSNGSPRPSSWSSSSGGSTGSVRKPRLLSQAFCSSASISWCSRLSWCTSPRTCSARGDISHSFRVKGAGFSGNGCR